MTMNSDREPACGMTTTMNGDRAEGTGLSSHDLFGVGAGEASPDLVRLQDVEVRSLDPEFAEGTGLLSRDPLEGAEPSAPENGEQLESDILSGLQCEPCFVPQSWSMFAWSPAAGFFGGSALCVML